MAKRSTGNTQYKRPWNINIGFIIFAVILLYLVISIFSYMTTEKLVGYEVKSGSLSTNSVYKGLALRREEIVLSDYSGYVNYYNEEGDRIGKGNLAYTVDESGTVMDYVESMTAGEAMFSDEALSELRLDILSFTNLFDPKNFQSVYEFKNSIRSTTQRLSSNSILANIREMDGSGLSASIHYGYAPATGDIVFSVDGYENRTFADIVMDDFDQSLYQKTRLDNGRLIAAGDAVFKLCTDENWQIVFPVDSLETAQMLRDEEYIRVRFLKNQYESWGKVDTRSDVNGQYFVCLSFTNSMVTFCGDRYIDIELLMSDEVGLKVPNSAIVDSEFFLVPKAYLTQSGSEKGVLRRSYAENGTMTTTFIPAPPYSETKEDYYLDQTSLRIGDVLVRPDSAETYTLGRMDTLTGVYNINKGYADFRQISILYGNEEYSIVVPNTMYGLSEYDYIVLDAEKALPDQFVYH